MIAFCLAALALGGGDQAMPSDVDGMTWLIRVTMSTTDAKGRTEAKPALVARTTAFGDSARAEILEGYGDFATGDVFLTHDGGRTLYLVRTARKSYSTVFPDSMGPQLARATSQGSLRATADSVQVRLEGRGTGMIDGEPAAHLVLTRRYDVLVRVLFLKKRVRTEETIDFHLAADRAPLPNPVGGLFLAILDAPSHAAPDLVRRMAPLRDSLRTGMPLRVVHRLVTGDAGDAVVTTTTIEVTALRPATGPRPSFALLPAWKRSDR